MVVDLLEGIGVCHLLPLQHKHPMSPASPIEEDPKVNKAWSQPSRSSEAKGRSKCCPPGPSALKTKANLLNPSAQRFLSFSC